MSEIFDMKLTYYDNKEKDLKGRGEKRKKERKKKIKKKRRQRRFRLGAICYQ